MYLTLYAPNRLMCFDRNAHFIDERGKKNRTFALISPTLFHNFAVGKYARYLPTNNFYMPTNLTNFHEFKTL